MSIKKLRILLVLIIILLLFFLNIQKYNSSDNEFVIPVWSSYDQIYYSSNIEPGLLEKFKTTFHPERLIYGISKIRLRAPITYLKREIPLLAYYTPDELQSSEETIYIPQLAHDNVIKLKFDLKDEESDSVHDGPMEEGDTLIDSSERIEKTEQEQAVIAIYHSHTAETYIDDPRKQDANGRVLPGNIGNIAKVGMELSQILSDKYGFKIIHTTKVHDEIYSRSYYNSRNTVKELLEKNPDIDLILDIHRDGVRNFVEETYTATINAERVARIMTVVTNEAFSFGEDKDNNKFERSDWQQNLALANALADRMDQMYPGLSQRVTVRDTTANRYNQDLHPHSLILEIGDYNNSTEEAIRSAGYLAEVIASMFL